MFENINGTFQSTFERGQWLFLLFFGLVRSVFLSMFSVFPRQIVGHKKSEHIHQNGHKYPIMFRAEGGCRLIISSCCLCCRILLLQLFSLGDGMTKTIAKPQAHSCHSRSRWQWTFYGAEVIWMGTLIEYVEYSHLIPKQMHSAFKQTETRKSILIFKTINWFDVFKHFGCTRFRSSSRHSSD